MTISDTRQRFGMLIDVGLLIVTGLLLMLAPLALPESFDWVRHTTSESAAQGIPGAWVARLGFLVFSVVVWRIAPLIPMPARIAFRVFASCLVAVAAFAARPWNRMLPYDSTEDLLHSIAASVMGVAFVVGVVVLLSADRTGLLRIGDVTMAAVATAIPLLMSADLDRDGMLQRGMFGTSFVWFAALSWSLRSEGLGGMTRRR